MNINKKQRFIAELEAAGIPIIKTMDALERKAQPLQTSAQETEPAASAALDQDLSKLPETIESKCEWTGGMMKLTLDKAAMSYDGDCPTCKGVEMPAHVRTISARMHYQEIIDGHASSITFPLKRG